MCGMLTGVIGNGGCVGGGGGGARFKQPQGASSLPLLSNNNFTLDDRAARVGGSCCG